jgi:ubiquinone/menaquinone biosynthesis C-methylase UbiE
MMFGPAKESVARQPAKGGLPTITKTSSGFEQFCSLLKSTENLSILDLAGASQANISFVTSLGHRISSEDIVGTMLQSLGEDLDQGQQLASSAQRFLDETLTFPDESFDGALVWDAMQLLGPPLVEHVLAQLLRVMRPKGVMLFFFSADEKQSATPLYHYRIEDSHTIQLLPRQGAKVQKIRFYNNRSIEKLFGPAASVKFFLTRDHLREVIARK